jgi:hypothetical protein
MGVLVVGAIVGGAVSALPEVRGWLSVGGAILPAFMVLVAVVLYRRTGAH